MAKLKVLYHSDSPVAKTGFGTVSRYVLDALHKTDNFEPIEVIGINHSVPYYDQQEFPYRIFPANYGGDSLGIAMTKEALLNGGFDVYFAVNDPSVHILLKDAIEEGKRKHGFKVVLYMPIDLEFATEVNKMAIQLADYPVLYTEADKERQIAKYGKAVDNVRVIPHGCDSTIFKPLSDNVRKKLRKDIFNIDDDTFLVMNVNRNQWRKNVFATILAFLKFWQDHKNSKLYLHMRTQDQGGNLIEQVASACLILDIDPKEVIGKVIMSPPPKNVGMSTEALAGLYGCADVFLSTTMGEGWGLTTTEAMSCGLPIILSDNTTARTLLGDEERGYLVGIGENTSLDTWNVAYGSSDSPRQFISVTEVIKKLNHVYDNRAEAKLKGHKAKKWARENTWEKSCKMWVDLFDEIINEPKLEKETAL